MMTKKEITKKLWTKLEEVLDPELYISIVDLGLVYKVEYKNGAVRVQMTLTTIGCPLFTIIEKSVKDKLMEMGEFENVYIDLVFDPPWSMERMTERGKALMGI